MQLQQKICTNFGILSGLNFFEKGYKLLYNKKMTADSAVIFLFLFYCAFVMSVMMTVIERYLL